MNKKTRSLLFVAFTLLLLFYIIPSDQSGKSSKITPEQLKDKSSALEISEEASHRELDNPQLAAAQNFEMTMDPKLGYPPTSRKLAVYEIIKQKAAQRLLERTAIPGIQWTERGPENAGGRTRAFFFDPNDEEAKRVWAGAVGGGLWVNQDITNPGSRWQVVPGIMSNLAVSDLAFDPTNTQVFYLSTGLGYTGEIQGEGIWKSTDGGTTWDQLSSTNNADFAFVQKLAVTAQGTVLATTLAGVMRSTDGGNTWESEIQGRFGDIEVASDGVIYVTGGVNSPGAIFRSTDGGANWVDITPEGNHLRIEIASAPSSPKVLYAVADRANTNDANDVEYFKKSTDGGNNWFDITIPLYSEVTDGTCQENTEHFTRGQAFFDLILSVHPENPDIVLAGGINAHRSMDGGQTWELVSYWTGTACDDYMHADQHAMMFRPGYPNQAIFGNDGGVYYSPDIGNAANPDFIPRNQGYNTVLFYSASMVNEVNSNVFLAGAQDNGTLRFDRPGINDLFSAFGGDGGFTFFDQDNPDIAITSTTFNNFVKSVNGGRTFTSLLVNDQNSGRFINPADYDSEENILYAAGNSDQLVRIDNIEGVPGAAETITLALGSRQISAIKVSPHTQNRIFIGVSSAPNGRVYRIDDAESEEPTVTDISGSMNGIPGSYVSSIDVGETDDQLLITFSNYGVTSVYETTDGGTNWASREGDLPDMPVRWGLYNPNDRTQALLATEMGVWSTSAFNTGSPSWEPSNAGLASVRTDMLRYRTSDETVLAATYGRGLFTTKSLATTVDANFSTSQIVSYVGAEVSFTDASLLPDESWSWNFGDGGTSNAQNPTHIYETPGTYDVSLSIANGADTETKSGYVTILPVKSLPYTLADGGDFESNPDDFTSRAIRNGVNLWERGTPGNRLATPASGTNVWKTLLNEDLTDLGFHHSSALYTPAFDFSDENKDYTIRFKKSMEGSFCNAPFGMQLQYSLDDGKNWQTLGTAESDVFGAVNWYNRSDTQGCAIDDGLFQNGIGWTSVNLDNNGTVIDQTVFNENTEYKLNFLAGQPNVLFRFEAGVLTNFSQYDRDGFSIDDFEIIANEPSAEFEAEVTSGVIGQNIQFTFLSVGAQTYLWDFGDGNTSTDENPVHAYETSGLFDVSLTITTADGEKSQTKEDYIFILPKREIPYTLEDGGNFEVNTTDFGVQNIAGTPFELGESNIAGKNGTASGENAWVTDLDAAQYLDESEARLLTPSFEFNTIGEYTLEFKANFSFEDNWDGFIVQYSTDFGNTWIKLNDNAEAGWYNQISDPQSVFGESVPIFSGDTGGNFQTFSTDVSFLFPNDNVVFRFLFLTDQNEIDVGMALDDFQLLGPAPGPAVPEFTFTGMTGCSGQQVVFTNASTGSISALDWDFGANASPATATGAGPHTVTYDGDGNSTVSLSATSSVNGTVTETKANLISTSPSFTPSFSEEDGTEPDSKILTASEGDAYQWYKDGTPIAGATERTLTITETGQYSVDVTVASCTVQTSRIRVITSTEDDRAFEKNVSVYPNPTSSTAQLRVADPFIGKMIMTVFNSKGEQISQNEVSKEVFEAIYDLELEGLGNGIYFIEVRTEKAKTVKRIIKK